MDKKGVMMEEWEAKRKRVEEKEEEKKGKGKKWFWEKSFCFLFDCVFASSLFFPAPTTPPRHNTRSCSPTTHHTTRRIGAHHHMQTGLCVSPPFLGVDSETHTASSTPHTPSLDITQHTPTNPTQTQLMVQATMR